MFKTLLFSIFLALITLQTSKCQDDIDELDKLIEILNKSGTNARVGFLSGSNYFSVKRVLPSNTKPVIIEHEEDLTQMVLNGSLIAALVSGMPEERFHDALHIFSSTIITLHSLLMAPEKSTELLHGVDGDLSTKHLSKAINAAITRIQSNGIDDKLAIKNHPKEIVHAYTCKDDDNNQFPLPNKKDAQGQLKNILENKKLKVLATGPYNWGDNDGNYLIDPPVGYYPDFLEAIAQQFKNLSGADKESYGEITIERIYIKSGAFPWYKLFDGSAHVTEPYFILDSAYGGSGKNCETDDDCFDADLPSGKETCRASKSCYHPPRAMIEMLRSSCTAVGTDSKFFTKRFNIKEVEIMNQGSKSLSGGLIALIVVLTLICAVTISFIGLLFYRKIIDKSSFSKIF
jgi:hypothetical protein